MAAPADFGQAIAKAYVTEGLAVELGQGVLDGTIVHEAAVRVALAMTNRHGLIAGAAEGDGAAKASPLYAKYGTRSDPQSAREMLAARLEKPTPLAAPPGGGAARGSR